MAQLLSGPILPTAVFAEYDELAMGALWALRRAGFRCPKECRSSASTTTRWHRSST